MNNPQPLRAIAAAVHGWVDRLGWVWVSGQVIQINRRAGSKTIFVTLRDELAEVSATLTVTPVALDAAGPVASGASVVAHLKPSFYPPTGGFSFVCDELRIVGEGQLLAQLEQRKRKLQAEGIFDPARKQLLPVLPALVGLIVGADSAAETDIVNQARRRWPAVRFRTQNCLVQGPQAAAQIRAAVRLLDSDPQVEVIIISRGGGSVADLLPFSDEDLVREVATARTPIVSAIGHDQDLPILDLVADVRASTPTDAAKRVVPDANTELAQLRQTRARMQNGLTTRLQAERAALGALRSRPVLREPTAGVRVHHDQLGQLRANARQAITRHLKAESALLTQLVARGKGLSPRSTLERGYAVLVSDTGRTITTIADLSAADQVVALLADGRAELRVTGTQDQTGAQEPKEQT